MDPRLEHLGMRTVTELLNLHPESSQTLLSLTQQFCFLRVDPLETAELVLKCCRSKDVLNSTVPYKNWKQNDIGQVHYWTFIQRKYFVAIKT